MPCNCEFCVLNKEIDETLNKANATPEIRALIEKLSTLYLNASENADYYKAILSGIWPQAKQILEDALQKIPN